MGLTKFCRSGALVPGIRRLEEASTHRQQQPGEQREPYNRWVYWSVLSRRGYGCGIGLRILESPPHTMEFAAIMAFLRTAAGVRSQLFPSKTDYEPIGVTNRGQWVAVRVEAGRISNIDNCFSLHNTAQTGV